jgi:hypothetical protein
MPTDDNDQQAPEDLEDDQQAPPEDDDQQDDDQQDDDQQDDDGDDDQDDDDDQQDGDTFPRPYVERLRARSAGYRARARQAEGRVGELERELFTERVRALDLLADPADLPYDPELLEDPDALAEAARRLVKDRPHYRRRGTLDGTGTGSRDRAGSTDGVSLAAIMRGQA